MSYIGNTQQNQNYFPAVDFFSGNGSTTAFTLSRPVASVAAIQAVVSNVAQNPSTAYTVSGNTITFTSAPPSGTHNIYVYYTSPNTQVVAPSDSTVQTSSIANGAVTTAKIADANITQAKLSSGVAGNGPAFSAYKNGSDQIVSNNVWTKITFNSESFDTANCYDATLSRFTPNVAGYYQVDLNVLFRGGYLASLQVCLGTIYKNGSRFRDMGYRSGPSIDALMTAGSCLIYLNGTTDYIEGYCIVQDTNGSSVIQQDTGGYFTYLQATLVRAA